MKKIVVASSLAALIAAGSLVAASAFAKDLVNVTPIEPSIGENGQRIISMPDKKKTSRRRMLFDFGLFGAGVHVGWLKPKNSDLAAQAANANNGGDGDAGTKVIKHRRGVGWPILNVSAGSHALGLGTH